MKIQKPKGRALVIEPDPAPQLLRTVRIETHTEEARAWIQEKAREFGNLYGDVLGERGVTWGLYVYAAYDRAEVIEYLSALWDSEHGASEIWPDEIVAESESK